MVRDRGLAGVGGAARGGGGGGVPQAEAEGPAPHDGQEHGRTLQW